MNKRTVENLIKKGKLTGEKLGQIAFEDYIRQINEEEQIFTDAEKEKFVRYLSNNENIRAYNGYIELCKILYDLIIMLSIKNLKVQNKILQTSILYGFLIQRKIKTSEAIHIPSIPIIMTEKQYMEESKKYKTEKLNGSIYLSTILGLRIKYYIENRAELITEIWNKYEKKAKHEKKKNHSKKYKEVLLKKYSLCYNTNHYENEEIKEHFPEFFHIAFNDIENLFKSGKLKTEKSFSEIPLEEYDKIRINRKDYYSTDLPEAKDDLNLRWKYCRDIAILKDTTNLTEKEFIDKNGQYSKTYETLFPDNLGYISECIKNLISIVEIINSHIKDFYVYYTLINALTFFVKMEYKNLFTEEEEILESATHLNLYIGSFKKELFSRNIKEAESLQYIEINDNIESIREGRIYVKHTKALEKKITKYLKKLSPQEYRKLSLAQVYNLYFEIKAQSKKYTYSQIKGENLINEH